MKTTIPQTLKGFRDFLPREKRAREIVLSRIVESFERFGFAPTQTPTLESADLLLGKYGEEADKLIYRFEDRGGRMVGLPYDQTVPTARLLSQYQSELPRMFRRYQVMNVFRAEKPQRGRYREFMQCDIDIFGSREPLADAEILAASYAAYKAIGFPKVILRINDRQLLFATLEPFATEAVTVFSLIQSIDKLDKLPPEAIIEELTKKGLAPEAAQKALSQIKTVEMSENLRQIVDRAVELGVPREAIEFSPNIARGLDYYTGMIFEVQIPEYTVGSCGGGGRYDQLIEQLGGPSIPAVGMAFGFDRTVEAALELGLIDIDSLGPKVLVTVFSEDYLSAATQAATALRQAGIATELYPKLDSLGKQFKAADQKGIPFCVLIGEDEAKADKVTLKNMQTGEQELLSVEELVKSISGL